MRSLTRSLLLGAVMVLATLGLASCGDDDDTGGSDTTSTDSSDEPTTTEDDDTTTTEPLPPEEQVWADLEAGTAAISAVAASPDPDAPELAQYFTGDSLAGLQGTMTDLQAGTGGSNNSAELHRYSVSVSGETATVDYCFVDSSQHLDTTGNPVEEPRITSMRSTAQMQLVEGIWKMAEATLTPEECPVS